MLLLLRAADAAAVTIATETFRRIYRILHGEGMACLSFATQKPDVQISQKFLCKLPVDKGQSGLSYRGIIYAIVL